MAGLFACFTARFTKIIMQVCFSIVLRLACYPVNAIIPICLQTEWVKTNLTWNDDPFFMTHNAQVSLEPRSSQAQQFFI